MKPSDMTNGQLAKELDNVLVNDELQSLADIERQQEAVHEAAARLRALSTLTTYTDNSKVIAELQRRLKVAEDALDESRITICHICDQKLWCGHGTANFVPCCIYKDIDSALTTIRWGKNGEK